jgi:UDP-N-acetylmuramyl pentapeptide phosphotransferase/UDP-N-acetylglucosamine-1-phosphate transferase
MLLRLLVIYFFIFAVTYAGVMWFRRWSLKRRLLDIPNERSSHQKPTPRGGGIVVSLICLISFFIYTLLDENQTIWAYFGGAVIVSGISWLDDLKTVSPGWRFLCHSIAAMLVIFEVSSFGGGNFSLEQDWGGNFAGSILGFFWIVWMVNAYNFMDGIDGIAGIQALTAGIGWSVIGFWNGLDSIGFYGGVLAVTAVGFLLHNWSPARVFPGDVGSAFWGFTFAVMPFLIKGESDSGFGINFLLVAVVLVWFFLFDSLLTLSLRLWRGEKVWEAHRSHIYQKLVQVGLSHSEVSLLYGFLSLLLMAVLFLLAGFFPDHQVYVILFALPESLLLLGILWKKSRSNK